MDWYNLKRVKSLAHKKLLINENLKLIIVFSVDVCKANEGDQINNKKNNCGNLFKY